MHSWCFTHYFSCIILQDSVYILLWCNTLKTIIVIICKLSVIYNIKAQYAFWFLFSIFPVIFQSIAIDIRTKDGQDLIQKVSFISFFFFKVFTYLPIVIICSFEFYMILTWNSCEYFTWDSPQTSLYMTLMWVLQNWDSHHSQVNYFLWISHELSKNKFGIFHDFN